MRAEVYPFVAVLGQQKIKNALIWNLVNPKIGGALIAGEKGTAKSTLVRGIAALSGNMRVVELPLNITEDRLVGSIDLKAALSKGKREPDPGLLKEADGNILYIDEVNLLSDYIANALLESASSGVNYLEREGISLKHASRFVLVGSMNPEEGKLRPQLLDRFGLYVEVEAEPSIESRVEIMRRRLEFEGDEASFIDKHKLETEDLRRKIENAKSSLASVKVTANALALAAKLASDLNCAGHRGEITLIEAAKAIAAMDSRHSLNSSDIQTAAEYALAHRARKAEPPPPPPPPPEDDSSDQPEPPNESEKEEENKSEKEPEADAKPEPPPPSDAGQQPSEDSSSEDDIAETGDLFEIPQWQDFYARRDARLGNGRRNRIISANHEGRYVGYKTPVGKASDLAFDATVRAAAPYQLTREKNGRAISIAGGDLRSKIREKRTGGFILFVVDASASMGANRRMKEVKGAILSMLAVSYQKRDRVGMIAFRKDSAELLLGFTRSVELAQKKLEQLPTGGRTPLASGLELAYQVIMGLKMREPDALPTIVLVSDGRANFSKGQNAFSEALKAAERIGNQGINTIIIDTENDYIRFMMCEKLNEKLKGIIVNMQELETDGIVQAVDALKGR